MSYEGDGIAIMRQFQDEVAQVRLIQTLQDATGVSVQTEFAAAWRNDYRDDEIDFVNCFRFYQNQPHQNIALRWLQQNVEAADWTAFYSGWSENEYSRPVGHTVLLKVPFFNQMLVGSDGWRNCNTASAAMCANYLGVKIDPTDYLRIVQQFGDTTDHNAQTRALDTVGINSIWRTNLGFAHLTEKLSLGRPSMVAIYHRGTNQAPTGGHVIVVIGIESGTSSFICHDPFGSLLDPGGGYTGAVENGRAVIYPRWVFNYRWLVDGGNSGWGRLFP